MGQSRGAPPSVPADRPVHRLLQLQPHSDVAAVKLGDLLEHVHIGAVWLLVGVILISALANFIMPQAIAKWALLAPVFTPLFLRPGVAPHTVLAAFRADDSPTNVHHPLMPYLALVVVVMRRYDKHSGLGTLISLMLPTRSS